MHNFCDDDLRDGARLELLDDTGRVVHVVGGAGPPSAAPQLTAAELARAGPGWRLRLLDAAGEVLGELPLPARH